MFAGGIVVFRRGGFGVEGAYNVRQRRFNLPYKELKPDQKKMNQERPELEID